MRIETLPLEKVCSLITDGTHYTPPNIGEGAPFLTVKDMTDDGLDFSACSRISHEEYGKALAGNSAPRQGDVLFSKDGTVGKVHVVNGEPDFAVLSSIAILRPHPHIVDSNYLGRVLSTPQTLQQAAKAKTGSALRRIILQDLKRVAVPVPPLKEQKRIAAILDKAEIIRRKRAEALRLADDFLESVFLDMFGDPLTNPKGWPIDQLGNHLTFVTSGSRGWAKYYASTGVRFIRSLDVQMKHISDSDEIFVNPPDSAETRRTLVCPDDVLLTITGSKIGRVAPVNSLVGEAYISQHVAILRLKDSIRPRFVSMFLSEPRGGQYQIQRMQYGQTKPGLNLEQLRAFEIPCPPLSMQDRFVYIWKKFDVYSQHHATAKQQTESLFNSLIQRAFRGEL